MRSEKEMFSMILDTAREDERIRAVYMNGSRTNANAPKDIFQDYDIVYVVTDVVSFIQQKEWIDRFGERLFMQYPDENPDFPNDKENCYGWLIQFTDGNRLDLHVETISHAREEMPEDSLCEVLLDKDGVLPEIPASSDVNYRVRKPTDVQFACCCNEFWWCLDNVAKGLWREEVTYVQDMLNFYIRTELEKMLSWKIGADNDFAVSIGKSGKYMHRFLTKEEWKQYLSTYSVAETEACWEAVGRMCGLFEKTALYVGEKLGYAYNMEEGKNCQSFLEHVRRLPKDAKEIY